MNTPIALALLTTLLPGEGDAVPDADVARALQLAAAPAASTGYAGSGPRELFHELGDDNVVSMVVHPDADGDGVPDVVAGWDIFKTGDNLTVSDGAGFLPGQLVWSLETADGLSGGYFGGQETLEVFVDVTGDGVVELIGCTGGGGRSATVYDGADGSVVQSFDTYLGAASGWVYDAAVVGDVNGNGSVDFAIAVGSDDNAVYMIDGASTGQHHDELWRFAGVDAVYGVVAVGDVDGDGVGDVVAGEGDNSDDLTALSGATGAVLWHANNGGNNWNLRAAPDQDGDGVAEVAIASWQTQGARLVDGRTGALRWSQPLGSSLVQRVVVLDDLDGDGLAELAFAAGSPGVRVLSGLDGALVWSQAVGSTVWAVDPVADVTGDGLGEVVFGDFAGLTRLADGSDGSILWTHDTNGHKALAVRGAPDLDGDGVAQVLVGAQQLSSATEPLLFVLDADSGVPGGPPELSGSGEVPVGGVVPLQLDGATPGHAAWLLLALDPALAPLFGKGVLALDPAAFFVLGVFAVPGPGSLALPLPLPANPTLQGVRFHLQTFVLNGGLGVSSNRSGHEVVP